MFFVLLAACASLPLPEACQDLVPPPVVACFGGEGREWPGYGTIEMNVEGTVVSVEAGARPDACLVDVGNSTFEEGLIVVIEDGIGALYTVGVAVPELSGTLVAEGDHVFLNAEHTFGEFGPDEGRVSLATDENAVVLAVAESGSLDGLPAVFDVAEGAARCTEDDGCGVFSKYDLDLTFGGETSSARYGESLALDEGGRFVHGGYERQAADQSGVCPDWFVAHVTVAFVDEDE